MQAQLTEFLLRLTFQQSGEKTGVGPQVPELSLSSHQILQVIHSTLNSEVHQKQSRNHKLSLSSEDTTPISPLKCNCKKSKCLKLYCECFSKGQFCQNCNCEGCHNSEQFSEERAKAIDEMVVRSSLTFGHKRSSGAKGCNCKKTGCQKKYCECFNLGVACSASCKCSNCENPPS